MRRELKVRRNTYIEFAETAVAEYLCISLPKSTNPQETVQTAEIVGMNPSTVVLDQPLLDTLPDKFTVSEITC